MPLFKNFLGTGNMAKFRSLLFREDTTHIDSISLPNDNVTIGVKYKMRSKPPILGKNPLIRSNSIIYNDVEIGDNFKTGHGVTIREKTTIGDNVLIGTNTVIEGQCSIGNKVSIQSNVYIPTNTIIEDYVFIGPCACFTNDKYPIRVDFDLKGPIIKKGASVGANSTFLSNIEIGEGAMVAAGAIVTMDVPEYFLAIGAPARIKPLPKYLKKLNKIN
jgi:acetyltransferase-like isoleucine patch superfamily enzyme